MSKKLLVITYDFFPDNTPNTYRWFNILKIWQQRGVDIHVVSAQKNNLPRYEIKDEIKIYRTDEFIIGKFKYKLKERSNNKQNQTQSQVRIVKFLYNLFLTKFYWPDFAFLWYFPTKKLAIELIEKNQINNIVTVSWPFTTHLIGHAIKKYNNNINWLAETIDPFSFIDGINNKLLYNNLNNYYERKIYLKADSITVLTENIKEKYLELYPNIKNKIFVVGNLYIPSERITVKNPISNTIKIVYVGALMDKVRSPENLLYIFSALTERLSELKLELHFYGDINDTTKYFDSYNALLDQSIFLHGRIEREEVPAVIYNADILVNIGNNNIYQEPSKVIEYIYSGKKILNICTLKNDTSLNILKTYPLHFNIDITNFDINQIAEKFLLFLRNPYEINPNETEKLIFKYNINNIEETYNKLIFQKSNHFTYD